MAQPAMAPLEQLVGLRTLEVGSLLFPEVESLDFAGPCEVFPVAARVAAARPGGRPRAR